MTYLNTVIRRTKPATRCQCAVLAVLNEVWSTPDEIWRRGPVYVDGKYLRVHIECKGGKRKRYRQPHD